MKRKLFHIIFIIAYAGSAHAQTANTKLNPLMLGSFKKNIKADTLLTERMKPSKHELMYWPNFTLTAAQAEARNNLWERRSRQSIGAQIAGDIASDIIKTQVNNLLYGKKMPVAVAPKF